MHHRPAQERIDDAGPVVVPAGQQAGPRGRADRGDVEVLEPDALPRQAIEVRRPDLGVAVEAEVAIALVVGDDQDHVGLSVPTNHRPITREAHSKEADERWDRFMTFELIHVRGWVYRMMCALDDLTIHDLHHQRCLEGPRLSGLRRPSNARHWSGRLQALSS